MAAMCHFLVNLAPECDLERAVGIVRSQEVRVTDELMFLSGKTFIQQQCSLLRRAFLFLGFGNGCDEVCGTASFNNALGGLSHRVKHPMEIAVPIRRVEYRAFEKMAFGHGDSVLNF